MGGEQRRATAVWEWVEIAVARPAVAVSPREDDVQSMLQPDQTRYFRKSSFGVVQGSWRRDWGSWTEEERVMYGRRGWFCGWEKLGTGMGSCCVSSSSSLSSVSELEGDVWRDGGDFLLCISCTTSLNRSQVIHLHCSIRETATASVALSSLLSSRERVSIAKRR